jgi:hypothetical protein
MRVAIMRWLLKVFLPTYHLRKSPAKGLVRKRRQNGSASSTMQGAGN